jgi:hypothetical protein
MRPVDRLIDGVMPVSPDRLTPRSTGGSAVRPTDRRSPEIKTGVSQPTTTRAASETEGVHHEHRNHEHRNH